MEWTIKRRGGPCRVNHAAVAVDNYIYSFGGYISGQNYRSDDTPIEVFSFNTRTYRWKTLTPCPDNAPFRRYGHSVVAYGQNIYLWGGRNDDYCDGLLYCYNTANESWSKPKVSGNVPLASDGHAACICGDIMYIHGGYVERISQFTLSLHSLNLSTMTWKEVPRTGDYPRHRDFHTMSAHPEGHLLVFGGREMLAAHYTGPETECYPSTLHMYDVVKKTWLQLPCTGAPPQGRRSHSAFIYNNSLYIFAGYNSRLTTHLNDLHSYDLGQLQWREHSSPKVRPVARRRQVVCLVEGKVFMFGGTHPDPHPCTAHGRILDEEEREPLEELDDLWVLDMCPSLQTLCLLRAVRLGLPLHGVPVLLQRRAESVPSPNMHSLPRVVLEEG